MSVSSPSVFLLSVSGQVEAGRFMGGDNLHFNYCFTAGHDWEVVACHVCHSEVLAPPCVLSDLKSERAALVHYNRVPPGPRIRHTYVAGQQWSIDTNFGHARLEPMISASRGWRSVCPRQPVAVMTRGSGLCGTFQ
ncbi:B9 domain-containing protein 1 [Chionoecetes opilio]|uniref:B9 domain-containing protein 1 n=1 Tax=Chionoecetes opilio TaxID=41210 RepID=A0A8J4Y9L9_CHIOP|nr:B9 domain-containing protein 1 [Chionoecetes opilio]